MILVNLFSKTKNIIKINLRKLRQPTNMAAFHLQYLPYFKTVNEYIYFNKALINVNYLSHIHLITDLMLSKLLNFHSENK